MKLTDYPVLKWYQDDLTSRSRDFYMCYKCRRVFTREQELEAIRNLATREDDDDAVGVCTCGSRKYSPTIPAWYQFLKPTILRFVIKVVLARGVAPWAETNWPELLPKLDKITRPKGLDIVS